MPTNAKMPSHSGTPARPSAIAGKLRQLSESDQKAFARLLEEVGEPGVHRILSALTSPGRGRPSLAEQTEPLLREMAGLLSQHPRWTVHRVATLVANGVAGKAERLRSGVLPESLSARLKTAWNRHAPRLLNQAKTCHRPKVPQATPFDLLAFGRQSELMKRLCGPYLPRDELGETIAALRRGNVFFAAPPAPGLDLKMLALACSFTGCR